MDDQHFDAAVKARLDDFSIEFDPAAMAQFHQLEDETAVLPWWKRSLPWIKWGLLLLILLINLGLLAAFLLERKSVSSLEKQVLALQENQSSQHNFKIIHRVDTLYLEREISTEAPPQDYSRPTNGQYTGTNRNWATSPPTQKVRSSTFIPTQPKATGQTPVQGFLGSGRLQHNSNNLSINGFDQNQGTGRLGNSDSNIPLEASDILEVENNRFPAPDQMSPYWNLPLFSNHPSSRRLNDEPHEIIEKSRTPLAFQSGLSMAFFLPQVNDGQALLSWGAGLHTELFLTPHLRLLGGVNISRPRFNADLPPLNESNIIELGEIYPGWLDVPGSPAQVEVRSNVLDMPLQLEYAFGLGYKSRLLVGAGWAPRLYMYQYFNYPFENNGIQANSSLEISKDIGWFSGTADGTLAMEFLLPKNYRWRMGFYYRHGLGPMGLEEKNYQIFGIRSGIWMGW